MDKCSSINKSKYFIYPPGEIVSLQLLLVSIEVEKKNKERNKGLTDIRTRDCSVFSPQGSKQGPEN